MKTSVVGNIIIIEIESCEDLYQILRSNVIKIEGECRFKLFMVMEHGGTMAP